VSSVASDVNATASVASAQWLQPPENLSDINAQPFAAVLDATVSAPNPANAPLTPPAQLAPTGAPANAASGANSIAAQSGTGIGYWTNGAARTTSAMTGGDDNGGTATPAADAQQNQSPNAATAATTSSGAAQTANASLAQPGPNASQIAAPDPANGAAQPGASDAAIAQSVQSLAGGSAEPADAAPVTKTRSNGGDADPDSDDGTATDAGAAAAAAATASQAQPVAAAVTVNLAAGAVPAPPSAETSGTTIGDGSRSRTKLAWPAASDAATGPNAKDSAAVNQAAPADSASAGTNGAAVSPNDTGNAQTPNNNAGPQQGQADGEPAPLAQTAANVPAGFDRTATRADQSASSSANAASSTDAPTGPGNTTGAGLPSFGLAMVNVGAPSAVAATPDPASAAAVPIAGLAIAIAARASAGTNQFDIRLDPPELGRIDVRLDVNSNGQVTSHITVDRADTLQLLQSQQPQLESALEQSGLSMADNGLQFMLRDQSFSGQSNSGGTQAQMTQVVIPDNDLPAVQSTQIYTRYGLGTGLDIRV
jgi:flagellar hook-length control protein FliK